MTDESKTTETEAPVDAVKAELDRIPNLIKKWAIPTLTGAAIMANPHTNPLLAALKAAVYAREAQHHWAHLCDHLEAALKAAGTRATNVDGEPLWLHMPADGAWVATAIVPPEGAEGYRPLYVR